MVRACLPEDEYQREWLVQPSELEREAKTGSVRLSFPKIPSGLDSHVKQESLHP